MRASSVMIRRLFPESAGMTFRGGSALHQPLRQSRAGAMPEVFFCVPDATQPDDRVGEAQNAGL